jgi:hypothetical protein
MWTLQEGLLKRKDNKIFIFCGSERVTMQALSFTYRAICENGPPEYELLMSRYLSTHFFVQRYVPLYDPHDTTYTDVLKKAAGDSWAHKPLFTVYDILNRSRRLQSTDARDKIFALDALLRRVGIDFYRADYSKDEAQVFREATKMMIEHDNDLDVLCEVPSPDRRVSLLPSWVPDWKDGPALLKWPTKMDDKSLAARRFASAREPQCRFGQDCKILSIRGVIIDEVSLVGEAIPLRDGDDLNTTREAWRVFKQWAKLLESMGEHFADRYPSGGSYMSALFDVIFQGAPFRFSDRPEEELQRHVAGFRIWFFSVSNYIRRPGGRLRTRIESSTPDESLRDKVEYANALYPDEAEMFYHTAWAACGRRIFIGTKKGYMGTLHGQANSGDVVALLSGFSMPVVLQKVYGGYRFAAYGYIRGIMEGEAWPKEDGKLEWLSLV